jgi:hypothetical protein
MHPWLYSAMLGGVVDNLLPSWKCRQTQFLSQVSSIHHPCTRTQGPHSEWCARVCSSCGALARISQSLTWPRARDMRRCGERCDSADALTGTRKWSESIILQKQLDRAARGRLLGQTLPKNRRRLEAASEAWTAHDTSGVQFVDTRV